MPIQIQAAAVFTVSTTVGVICYADKIKVLQSILTATPVDTIQ
jgi:hypothetical protein